MSKIQRVQLAPEIIQELDRLKKATFQLWLSVFVLGCVSVITSVGLIVLVLKQSQ